MRAMAESNTTGCSCRTGGAGGPNPNGSKPPDRRTLLKIAMAAGLASLPDALAAATKEPKDMRPQPGDRFVYAYGDKEGEVKPDDLKPDSAPVIAWPVDPASQTVRDGSMLNYVLLARVDPAKLDEGTKANAADGIVAYSAICTHVQCPVSGWNAERKLLLCPCHQSGYDPSQGAKVVGGPAPRPLPALPVKIENGSLVAAGTFLGRVGGKAA
jgi:Rieske Fe-S protein